MLIQLKETLHRHRIYLEQDPFNQNLLLNVGLLQAQILYHQQQLTEATSLLEKLASEHQSSADVVGLLALTHIDNNEVDKAEVFSQKALTLNPGNYEGRLVQTLLHTSQQKAAIEEIEALIKINPQESRLWFALGSTQMRHLNLPAAEHAFSQTTRLSPDFYDSWICSGWCHLLQGNTDKAEATYQRAINIDAHAADGWGGIALICALKNNMSTVNDALQKAELLDPECFLARITRIMVANQLNPAEAVRQYNLAFPRVAAELMLLVGLYK